MRRVIAKRVLPPEEFAFVGLGLVLGSAGALWQALLGFGAAPVAEPAPFFAQRLVSLGMMLSSQAHSYYREQFVDDTCQAA